MEVTKQAGIRPWRELRKDRFVLSALAIGAVLLLVSLFPILPPQLLAAIGACYGQLVLLLLAVAALQVGLRRIEHAEERRFWHLLTLAFAIWAMADVLHAIFPAVRDNLVLNLISDCIHLLSFLSLALAILQQPHRRSRWSAGDLSHRFSTIGTAIFIAALLVYFVLLPSNLEPARYQSVVPTMYLYLILDLFLVVGFFAVSRTCGSDRWRALYGLLGAASILWTTGDLLDVLYYSGIFLIPTGTIFDLVFYVPLGLVIYAGRSRGPSVTPPYPDYNTVPVIDKDRLVSTGILSAYALLYPLIHFTGYLSGAFDEDLHAPRGALVVVVLLLLVTLTLLQQIVYERRHREVESSLTVLVTNEQLLQSQKMEAIGRLASGISHEFNNLLLVIRGYSEFLKSSIDPSDPSYEDVEQIQSAVRRASSITGQLLSLGRADEGSPSAVDLNEEIERIERVLRLLIGEDIQLVCSLGRGLGYIKADPGQVTQIILNLVINARAAMPRGGKLEIQTKNVEFDEPQLRKSCTIPAGRFVNLCVRDTGQGIPPELQSRVFEPFFTSRQTGNGIGLSAVWSIVQKSHGYTCFDSEPGEGTTFCIVFPRMEIEVDRGPAPSEVAKPHPAGGRETILLVEDEEPVRALLRTSLDSSGYRILEAADGAQAIQISQIHDGPIDLLLTDVVMPGVSGPELAEVITRSRSAIKVLYMSSYTDDSHSGHPGMALGEGLLQKPFSLDALRDRVQEVLRETLSV